MDRISPPFYRTLSPTGAAAQKGTKASAQAIESPLFIPLDESAPSRQNSAQSRGNFRMLHIVDMSF